MDLDEACDYMRVKKTWMYQNHKKLGIPCYSIGRKLVFKLTDLDSWIASKANV